MSALKAQTTRWPVQATDPPKLTTEQWSVVSLLGVVFLLMAIFQLIGFSDFRDMLGNMGLAGPSAWAVILVLAELWAAAGLFKWRLSHLFRVVSAALAILVAGFWFVENLQLIANGSANMVGSSGFFGKYLTQNPGWWSAIEASLLLFWTLYAVELFKPVLNAGRGR